MNSDRRRQTGTGTEVERKRVKPERGTLRQTEMGVGVPDSPAAEHFISPLELFSGGKLTPALGGGGKRHPVPLPQSKYSMARWQEGCPQIRVFPSPLPHPSQGNVKGGGSCLLGWGRGTSQSLSVHSSHLPDLSTFSPTPKHPACPAPYQRDSVTPRL